MNEEKDEREAAIEAFAEILDAMEEFTEGDLETSWFSSDAPRTPEVRLYRRLFSAVVGNKIGITAMIRRLHDHQEHAIYREVRGPQPHTMYDRQGECYCAALTFRAYVYRDDEAKGKWRWRAWDNRSRGRPDIASGVARSKRGAIEDACAYLRTLTGTVEVAEGGGGKVDQREPSGIPDEEGR